MDKPSKLIAYGMTVLLGMAGVLYVAADTKHKKDKLQYIVKK